MRIEEAIEEIRKFTPDSGICFNGEYWDYAKSMNRKASVRLYVGLPVNRHWTRSTVEECVAAFKNNEPEEIIPEATNVQSVISSTEQLNAK